ncbi:hypothetical protein VUR80DRAFT_1362 [Thermomyces stellatus]
MPIIREEFTKFVQLWNNHYIRSQRSRPHVVPGQPWVLYHSFDQNSAKDFGFVPHQDRLDLLKEVSDADPYDLDAYLLPEVEAIYPILHCIPYLTTKVTGLQERP